MQKKLTSNHFENTLYEYQLQPIPDTAMVIPVVRKRWYSLVPANLLLNANTTRRDWQLQHHTQSYQLMPFPQIRPSSQYTGRPKLPRDIPYRSPIPCIQQTRCLSSPGLSFPSIYLQYRPFLEQNGLLGRCSGIFVVDRAIMALRGLFFKI